jgi:hypothetical protein
MHLYRQQMSKETTRASRSEFWKMPRPSAKHARLVFEYWMYEGGQEDA